MKRKILLFVTTILLMVGCGPTTGSPTTPTSTLDSVPVANTTVAPKLNSPTATLVPSPTPVPIGTPDSRFKTSCLVFENSDIPMETVATGTVALDRDSIGRLFLLDLQSDNEYEIPVQSKRVVYFGFQASPDRNLLAYIEGLHNSEGQFIAMMLWIVNAGADVLEKITFNLPGLYSLRWLDNQSMIFHTDQTPKDGTVIFFNPNTGEQRFISNELPGYYIWSNLVPRQSSIIEYASNLEWGVYLGYVQTGNLGFLVRDFVSGQTVWQMADTFGEYQRPVWSPNDDEVAVVAGGHIYLVNREGMAYPVPDENLESRVSDLSWSPDGRYLVFWNLQKLNIYDSQSKQVIDLCITNEYPDRFIWSPDSHQFIYGAYLDEGGVLVDLQKMIGYKLLTIPDTLYPVAWMNSIP